MTTTASAATDKQLTFIDKLLTERVVADEVDITVANRSDASALISKLLKMPHKPHPMAAPGYYVSATGQVAVVVNNKAGTATYAKRLRIVSHGHAKWEYAPGVAAKLANSSPLTVQEAAKLGHLHGVCVVCARPLTNPASVEAGIGPVCAKKL